MAAQEVGTVYYRVEPSAQGWTAKLKPEINQGTEAIASAGEKAGSGFRDRLKAAFSRFRFSKAPLESMDSAVDRTSKAWHPIASRQLRRARRARRNSSRSPRTTGGVNPNARAC